MYKITGLDIEITRGDTLALLYKFDGRELPYGTDAIFTIKKKPRDEEHIVQHRVDASDGTATIFLGSDDTNFDARTYYWDIRLQMPREEGGYEIQTPMEYAAFTIVEVIGGDIGSGDSEEVNPDLPVLQIVLEETKEVLARADTVVSSLEALNVEAHDSDYAEAEVQKNEDGSLSIVLGLPRGDKGDRGDRGIQGERGFQGEKGDPFVYSDFTPEQLEALRGPQGVQGLTGKTGERGEKGDPFTYDDFTDDQLAALRGPQGMQGDRGEKGDPFRYEDFTAAQLAALKGAKGDKGDTGADGRSFALKGMYASYSALVAAHPTGNDGDAYAVGTSSSNTVYIWDVDDSAWANVGALQGAAGSPGAPGKDGEPGSDGVGIASFMQTTSSNADGGTNVVTVTLTDGTKKTFSFLNGSKGSAGSPGKDGAAGASGSDGVSVTSVAQTTTSNADGGSNVITVTLSDGKTSTFTVKNGSKGSAGTNGSDGSPGADGVGISSVRQTSTSNADGGSNVMTVTLSNGTTSTFTVKNGSKGSTPVKGTDYFTSADKAELVNSVLAALPAAEGVSF